MSISCRFVSGRYEYAVRVFTTQVEALLRPAKSSDCTRPRATCPSSGANVHIRRWGLVKDPERVGVVGNCRRQVPTCTACGEALGNCPRDYSSAYLILSNGGRHVLDTRS
jgi:hypothetical protein